MSKKDPGNNTFCGTYFQSRLGGKLFEKSEKSMSPKSEKVHLASIWLHPAPIQLHLAPIRLHREGEGEGVGSGGEGGEGRGGGILFLQKAILVNL